MNMSRNTKVGLWLLVTNASDVGWFFLKIHLLVGQEARSSLIKNLIKKRVLCFANMLRRKCVCSSTKADVLLVVVTAWCCWLIQQQIRATTVLPGQVWVTWSQPWLHLSGVRTVGSGHFLADHLVPAARVSHGDSYIERISSPTFRKSRSYWHWEGVNWCMHLLLPPPRGQRAHVQQSYRRQTSGEAEQASWLLALAEALKVNIKRGAFQIQIRRSNWCRSCRNADSSSISSRHTVFGAWIVNTNVRSGAEMNTSVRYLHLTGGGSYLLQPR